MTNNSWDSDVDIKSLNIPTHIKEFLESLKDSGTYIIWTWNNRSRLILRSTLVKLSVEDEAMLILYGFKCIYPEAGEWVIQLSQLSSYGV